MDAEFIDLTPENIEDEHLCCIIRTKKGHPGIEAKRAWLKERLGEGHIFRSELKSCGSTALQTAYRQSLSLSTRSKKRKRCPACSITGRCSMTENS